MISYILAIIIFAGLGAAAFFGYKSSMELAERLDSGRRRESTPPRAPAAVSTPVPAPEMASES